MTISTLVIIPTYNERENLPLVVARVLESEPEVDILVVDDASPDGTGAIASALSSGHDRVHVLHRAGKEGLGAAYRAGFDWGLANGFDRLVEMDADGSHQPEQLHRLLDALEDADVVLGSRWIEGGAVENWPLRRALLSRGGSLYARMALGLPVRDITGGFRAFRASALIELDYHSVASQGYCFQIDMLWHAHLAGLRIKEVPITFVERVHGISKMSPGIVREAMARVTVWGLRGLPTRLRSAALLQQALSFLLVGGVGFVIDLVLFNVLRTTVLTHDPIAAKVISTSFAILANWIGNRYWTFRSERRRGGRAQVIREAVEFGVVSAAGSAIALGCLWISHYGLGLTSVLDDNVATNVIGLALGTAFRFVLYRVWVFGSRRSASTVEASEVFESSRIAA
jgi:dolichol-phosphate mannosyltransferase